MLSSSSLHQAVLLVQYQQHGESLDKNSTVAVEFVCAAMNNYVHACLVVQKQTENRRIEKKPPHRSHCQ